MSSKTQNGLDEQRQRSRRNVGKCAHKMRLPHSALISPPPKCRNHVQDTKTVALVGPLWVFGLVNCISSCRLGSDDLFAEAVAAEATVTSIGGNLLVETAIIEATIVDLHLKFLSTWQCAVFSRIMRIQFTTPYRRKMTTSTKHHVLVLPLA